MVICCLITLFICSLTSAIVTEENVDKFKSSGQLCSEEVRKKIESDSYNKLSPPFPDDGSPLNIYAGIYTEGLSSVATVTMDFNIDIYLYLRWVDKRIAYNCGIPKNVFTMFPNDYVNKFWIPGIYFANSRQSSLHHVMSKNAALRVWPDGHARLSIRVTMKVICNMQLAIYPFDTQQCELMFMDCKINYYDYMPNYNNITDSFPNTLMNVSWMPEELEPAIAMSDNIEIPEMRISSVASNYCDGAYDSGVWSCLTMKIILKRITTYHMYQTYLPSALIVLISFTNFWLEVDAMPGRISLSITTLLTLTTQASSLRLALPPVSYMKAIDIWMMTCQFFVLGALLEFTLVNYISRRYKAVERKQAVAATAVKQQETLSGENDDPKNASNIQSVTFSSGKSKAVDIKALAVKCRQQAQYIDYLARVLYPLMFLVFNIVYWSYFVSRMK